MSKSATPRAGAALSVRGLRRAFGDAVVLDDVDLDLRAGEVVVLSGENGAGKSTLLECLAGAQPADAGRFERDGAEVQPHGPEHHRAVYGLLDDLAWFPDLTVLDHYRLLDPSLDRDGATDLLSTLGAEAHVDRVPLTLSSGQRQRCALVSALVRPWEVLLIDEPERHLDVDTVPALGELILRLAGRGAVLIASHDPVLTDLPGVRRLVLDAGRLRSA